MAIGERIRLARKRAQLSMRELAARVGLSAQAISLYERDLRSASTEILVKLARELGVRVEFFFREPQRVRAVEFRKRAHLSKKCTAAAEAFAQDWLERYVVVETILDLQERPDLPRPRPVTTLEEAEAVALALREHWKLGDSPIRNLVALLEDKGIKVGVLPDAPEGLEACSLWADGMPAIVVSGTIPGDRQRLSVAHELGHLLLESAAGIDKEKAAFRFGAAFLVPRAVVIRELGSRREHLDRSELYFLKHEYGLSMRAWVMRAQDCGVISGQYARWLHSVFARQGWHRQEPGEQVPPERPTRMEQLVMRALAEGLVTESRAAELLGRPLPIGPQDATKAGASLQAWPSHRQ